MLSLVINSGMIGDQLRDDWMIDDLLTKCELVISSVLVGHQYSYDW